MSRTFHIVGNWKMNQTVGEIDTFLKEYGSKGPQDFNCQQWIAPQSMHLTQLLTHPILKVGAQNIHQENSGAFTGENSASSLKDLGAHFTLIGHSERRSLFGENDELLNQKLHNALENNLVVIFCVGETLEERETGSTTGVISQQLSEGLAGLKDGQHQNIIVAYEPVWAIGTGKTASPEQAQEVHQHIRTQSKELGFNQEELIILYGGSVKPSNAADLLGQADIDGALVGGASLKGGSFAELCQIAHRLTT